MVWTVDVTYTDRTRDENGRFNERTTTVIVDAPYHSEAMCIAAQLVAATRPESHMVTGTMVAI